jgi:hypothetical protein
MNNLVRIIFTETVYLPRFKMELGSVWMKRKDRITEEGFPLGGGFVYKGQYRVDDEY